MKCDVCQTKPSTVFLTQIVEGKMQQVNLCESCAKEKGVTDPTGFALAEMLLGFGSEKEVSRKPEELTCQCCGFTQTDFKKTGRLGCSACYRVFGDGLTSLLEAMHNGTKHFGKTPAKYQRDRTFTLRLDDLKNRMKISIEDENFEEAARLRDEIQQMVDEFDAHSV